MKKILMLLLCVSVALFGLVGCNGGTGGGAVKAKPVSIALSGQKTDFIYGDRFTTAGLKVTVTLDDGKTRQAMSREYTVDASAFDSTQTGDYPVSVKLVADAAIAAAYTVTVRKTAPAGDGKDPTLGTDVDVYIIAGQSNAEGSSELGQLDPQSGSTFRAVLTAADRRNISGYDVQYYGTVLIGQDQPMPALALQPVKMGLGTHENRIGPELGMANVLQDNSANPVAIFKYASGDTSLCDVAVDRNTTQYQGNWASPSIIALQKQQGNTYTEHQEHLMGLMYRRLLTVVENGCAALRRQGYNPHVKGYAWMQGEADAGREQDANLYERYLKLFIADLRADVARVSGDAGAATATFVIGKISPNGWYGEQALNDKVRAAQDAVAAALAANNVTKVETADLIINEGSTTLGSDAWHFNARDMYILGQRFARAALGGV